MTETRAPYAAELTAEQYQDFNLTSEYDHQCRLFQWARENMDRYPALKWMFATLNGVRLTPGTRVKASKQGMTKGVLDVWLVYPAGGCPGMAFELKYGRGKPTAEQAEWLEHLQACGWNVGVYYTWREAAAGIMEYLGGEG